MHLPHPVPLSSSVHMCIVHARTRTCNRAGEITCVFFRTRATARNLQRRARANRCNSQSHKLVFSVQLLFRPTPDNHNLPPTPPADRLPAQSVMAQVLAESAPAESV